MIKVLKQCDLKLTGTERDEAEDFLVRLLDCKSCAVLTDEEFLQTLPIILQRNGSHWCRSLRREIRTWKVFKMAFKNEYLVTVDDEGVRDELGSRTSGKGKKISPYLTSLRFIMGYLKRPLDKNK